MINMDIAKSEDERAAEEIIEILKTFFKTKKHILLTAPPGHGKTWVINRIYDIFEFQKLFDKHREEVLKLKQGTFKLTFERLKQKYDKRDKKNISEDEENPIDDDIMSIVNSYLRILRSVSGNHVSLYNYVIDYLEDYMSSNEISNHFNHGIIKIAPTGVAASNIDGMTYHSFFSLNIFSNSTRQEISDADSRIIRYLQNIDGCGIADLLYGIPDSQERMKIITNNDNLFRVINQEIIIFDEISMIYDISLDLLWKLTHDLQNVVTKIHEHFGKIRKYNKTNQKNRFYTGLEKGIHETKRNYTETMISMDGLDLMFHIAAFFFKMIPERSDIDFKTFSGPLRRKETYDKITEKINKRKEKMKDCYNKHIRRYLENLCLKMVYELFRRHFETNESEVPSEIKLYYDVMRFCNKNYNFISNMKEFDYIKPIKFLFVGDFLQIQPFENIKYDRKFEPNEIARYYLETKSIADETVSLYKDINSYFADIFIESDKIEKLTLTICKRQTKEESDFRKLISEMRHGERLSDTSLKLLEGKIINRTVDELLTKYINDKNNFTILSMCNYYANYINNSLILRDYKGDIDLVPNTLLEKNVKKYKGRRWNIYLNTSISAENIKSRITQLCYITYFLKSSSIRRSFHITLDEKRIDFLKFFRVNLTYSIIDFLETDENGPRIYNNLPNLCRLLIDRYKVECYEGKIKYKYNISEEKLDEIRLIISLDDKKYTNRNLKINLNDFRKDIEDKIENILSNNNLDLDSACKKFLDDIKYDILGRLTVVTLHKLKMKLTYYEGIVHEIPIDSEIILPVSENEVIIIREIPIKKTIRNRGTSNESSNISIFVKNMKCMITKNRRSYKSDTGFLYVNGSMGHFDEIDEYGKLYVKLKDRKFPVDVFPEIEHQSGKFFCLRFPIVPAYSISINKSQGLTIPGKVILNLNQNGGGMWWYSHQNKDWFFNLVVAISRCTKIEDLVINRYIDGDPRGINKLSKSDFITYMFDDMYERADPKSRLIFDIERVKERCQRVLRIMYNRRKKRKFDEWRRRT